MNLLRRLLLPAMTAIGCIVQALSADAQITSQTAGLSSPGLDLSALSLMDRVKRILTCGHRIWLAQPAALMSKFSP
jgi:hypothetical protein